eukprot:4488568-Alexandrium_andersonii.AAC.1
MQIAVILLGSRLRNDPLFKARAANARMVVAGALEGPVVGVPGEDIRKLQTTLAFAADAASRNE